MIKNKRFTFKSFDKYLSLGSTPLQSYLWSFGSRKYLSTKGVVSTKKNSAISAEFLRLAKYLMIAIQDEKPHYQYQLCMIFGRSIWDQFSEGLDSVVLPRLPCSRGFPTLKPMFTHLMDRRMKIKGTV